MSVVWKSQTHKTSTRFRPFCVCPSCNGKNLLVSFREHKLTSVDRSTGATPSTYVPWVQVSQSAQESYAKALQESYAKALQESYVKALQESHANALQGSYAKALQESYAKALY